MIAASFAPCSRALLSRSARSTLPSLSQATTTTFMPAMCADAGLVPCAEAGNEADVAMRLAAARVPGLDREQARVLALRAGIRLQRHRRVAGDRAQHPLEVGDELAIAFRLVGRRERVNIGERRPRHRNHLARRVQLHRARAERDHRAVERDVAVGETAQVAQHVRLRAVAAERRMGEERRRRARAPRAARRPRRDRGRRR